MLARLLAVADDVDAGVLLLLEREQRGVALGLRRARRLRAATAATACSGSASQAGFGRLPAMVVWNIRHGDCTCYASGCLPAIEPIVARSSRSPPMAAQRERAQKRRRPAEVIDRAVAAGGALDAGGAPLPLPLVAAHGARPDRPASRASVAPAPRRPRSPWRRPGRGTAASDGRHRRAASPAPGPSAQAARGRRAPISASAPARPGRARRRRPCSRGIAREELGAVAGRAPAGLAPVVADDGDDIDEAPLPYRIVHQMRVRPEPQMDCRRARNSAVTASAGASARQAVGVRSAAPSDRRAARAGSTTARRRRSARCRVPRRSARGAAPTIVTPLRVHGRSPRPACRAAARCRDARAPPPAARPAGRRDGSTQ